MPFTSVEIDVTRDAFLDGRFIALQPQYGYHRSGSDAILLAAAVPAREGCVVDLGAGVGVVGLALAARIPGIHVTLVERNDTMLWCAHQTLKENPHFAQQLTLLKANICAPRSLREDQGLMPAMADHVMANPPYFKAHHTRATRTSARHEARVIEDDDFATWIACAADILRPSGSLTLIQRAEALYETLQVLDKYFGAITIHPLQARMHTPAKRIILRAWKGRRTPAQLMPAIILHEEDSHAYRPSIIAVLRDGAPLL